MSGFQFFSPRGWNGTVQTPQRPDYPSSPGSPEKSGALDWHGRPPLARTAPLSGVLDTGMIR